jgi:hypothetical protein
MQSTIELGRTTPGAWLSIPPRLVVLGVMLFSAAAITRDFAAQGTPVGVASGGPGLEPGGAGVLLLRLSFAALCTYTLCQVYRDRKGIEMRYEEARLVLIGWRRWSTFTVWCFTVLTAHFWLAVLAKICAAAAVAPAALNILLRLSRATFEVSYPLSILVTVVVTFVLFPQGLKRGFDVQRMFRFRPQVMHNANVVMMQVELVSAPWTVQPSHVAFVTFFCSCYAVFSWFWFRRTGVFYYFFLDYRRRWAWLTYLGFFAALGGLYALSVLASRYASLFRENPVAAFGLILFTLAIMRVRAPAKAAA